MKERICKLLSVKSIVTLSMTSAFLYILISGREVQPELLALFSSTYGAVMTYYFTKGETTPTPADINNNNN